MWVREIVEGRKDRNQVSALVCEKYHKIHSEVFQSVPHEGNSQLFLVTLILIVNWALTELSL